MLIQCAIPVFEGLLPEPHNTRVLKLLFDLAHWHGLAKLQMHMEATLELLSQATIAPAMECVNSRRKRAQHLQPIN